MVLICLIYIYWYLDFGFCLWTLDLGMLVLGCFVLGLILIKFGPYDFRLLIFLLGFFIWVWDHYYIFGLEYLFLALHIFGYLLWALLIVMHGAIFWDFWLHGFLTRGELNFMEKKRFRKAINKAWNPRQNESIELVVGLFGYTFSFPTSI